MRRKKKRQKKSKSGGFIPALLWTRFNKNVSSNEIRYKKELTVEQRKLASALNN